MTVGVSNGDVSADPRFVRIGDRSYAVHLQVSGELDVEMSSGGRVRLEPWTLYEHLEALDRHVDASGGVVRFDDAGFVQEMLVRSGLSDSLAGELGPLALWWAVGGRAEPLGEVKEGVLSAGGIRARLRRWTFAEREQALASSVVMHTGGGKEFKLAKYLRAMVEASVVALESGSLEGLAGEAVGVLLEAVTTLNGEGDSVADRMVREGGEGGKALAATTLRICRALGWTPSQVWGMPAGEIDRVVAMLDAVEGSRGVKGGRGASLADYPDAVVIQVEDG